MSVRSIVFLLGIFVGGGAHAAPVVVQDVVRLLVAPTTPVTGTVYPQQELQVDDELTRAEMTAPFDGVVTERLRRAGEDIGRGTVVARLIETTNLLRVRGHGRDAEGIVREVVPGTDPRRQAFELYVDLPIRTGARPWSVGEQVNVSLPILAPAGSLAVPQDALVLRQGVTYVFRVAADGTAERIEVEAGESHDRYVAVHGGLVVGDKAVIRGAESLTTGRPVRIQAGG